MMEDDDIHVVDGKFTFSEDVKKVVHTTYKKTKPKLADMEGSLPPVNWDTRSKPVSRFHQLCLYFLKPFFFFEGN